MAENVWGYVSQEEMSTGNFGSWKFGVNFDVRLKDIEYHKATKNDDGKEISAKVVITFCEKDNSEATKSLTIWEPDENNQRDFTGNILVKGTEEFEKSYQKQVKTATRALCNISDCFIDPRKINEGIKKTQEKLVIEKKEFGFPDYVNIIISAIKSQSKWNEKPLDLFLQWSSKLSTKGNSYLEIPNANQGLYVCEHKEGEWEEEKIPMHHYKLFLKENGIKTQKMHPIMRGNFSYFWEHNAEQVKMEETNETFTQSETNTKNEKSSSEIDWDNI